MGERKSVLNSRRGRHGKKSGYYRKRADSVMVIRGGKKFGGKAWGGGGKKRSVERKEREHERLKLWKTGGQKQNDKGLSVGREREKGEEEVVVTGEERDSEGRKEKNHLS